MDVYREIIRLKPEISMLDETVDLLTETVCTKKGLLGNAGDVYPSAVVKSKPLKLEPGILSMLSTA